MRSLSPPAILTISVNYYSRLLTLNRQAAKYSKLLALEALGFELERSETGAFLPAAPLATFKPCWLSEMAVAGFDRTWLLEAHK